MYQVVLADVPWSYKNKKTGGSMKSASNQHYSVLEYQDISKIDLNKVVSPDAVIFLWVTNPMMNEGLQLLRDWGFTYKTMITWVKTRCLGMGSWFRGNTEHILVGVRGDIKALRCQSKNYLEHGRLRHSEKPEVFRELIEKATVKYPKKLELFGNKKREGWTVLGINHKNIAKELTALQI